ncbi:MAG: phosphatase PAP2 family protein [Pseudomonadota bacterium]
MAMALIAINAVLMMFRGGAIDAQAYGLLFAAAVAVGALGQFYRRSGRGDAIGDALTCTALMILFSNAGLVFNFLLLPLATSSIDLHLIEIDSWFGYSWPAAVEFAANNPWINEITRYAYNSTMPQITVLVVLLGLMGRKIWLHRLLLLIVTTTIVLIAFWALFPSHGPSAFYTLSPEVAAAANPVVGSDYGVRLLEMMKTGPERVTPAHVEGLIAFPSYHTTLAFICAYCAYGIRFLFPIFLTLNLIILPGTLMHGGHHLVDLFAGLVLFLLGLWAINRLTRRNAHAYDLEKQPGDPLA